MFIDDIIAPPLFEQTQNIETRPQRREFDDDVCWFMMAMIVSFLVNDIHGHPMKRSGDQDDATSLNWVGEKRCKSAKFANRNVPCPIHQIHWTLRFLEDPSILTTQKSPSSTLHSTTTSGATIPKRRSIAHDFQFERDQAVFFSYDIKTCGDDPSVDCSDPVSVSFQPEYLNPRTNSWINH